MNSTVKIVAAGVGGLVVGAVGTYFLTRKRIELKYAMLLDQEIADLKDYYRRVVKPDGSIVLARDLETVDYPEDTEEPVEDMDDEFDPEDEFPVEDHETAEAIVVENHYLTISQQNEKEASKNAFDNPVDETEVGDPIESPLPMLPEPDPNHPYIISVDQWGEDYVGYTRYEKISLRYFEGDNTLCSEEASGSSIIHKRDDVVGEKNLGKFGFASGDDAIVYVRNEAVETDFEIIRDPGDYTDVVLGMTTNYSEKNKIKKMRDDD